MVYIFWEGFMAGADFEIAGCFIFLWSRLDAAQPSAL
jgi:hypothetical protein